MVFIRYLSILLLSFFCFLHSATAAGSLEYRLWPVENDDKTEQSSYSLDLFDPAVEDIKKEQLNAQADGQNVEVLNLIKFDEGMEYYFFIDKLDGTEIKEVKSNLEKWIDDNMNSNDKAIVVFGKSVSKATYSDLAELLVGKEGVTQKIEKLESSNSIEPEFSIFVKYYNNINNNYKKTNMRIFVLTKNVDQYLNNKDINNLRVPILFIDLKPGEENEIKVLKNDKGKPYAIRYFVGNSSNSYQMITKKDISRYTILLDCKPNSNIELSFKQPVGNDKQSRGYFINTLAIIGLAAGIFTLIRKRKLKKVTTNRKEWIANGYQQAGSTMRVVPGNAQHIGSREEQQDAFGFSNITDTELVARSGVLAVLADGMGGLAKGRDASVLAVRTMLKEYTVDSVQSIPEALYEALKMSNKAVYDLACNADLEGNVGTTLAATVIRDGQLHWVSVGDSRIYLYRKRDPDHKGELTRLTVDHNLASQMLEKAARGVVAREYAEGKAKHNALTSYLGLPALDEVDFNVRPLTLQPGDRIVLCSDGIYGSISEEEMTDLMEGNPQDVCELLVQRVLAKKDPRQDNMTVAILAYEEQVQYRASRNRGKRRGK